MLRLLAPHLRVESVLDLDLDRLRQLGLDSLLLDVDCTLKSYRSESVSDEVRAWLDELRVAGVGLCLVSNGLGRRVGGLAEKLDLPFIAKAGKPLPFGCRAAIRKLGCDRRRTAMVGDQLFADVMAARLAGMTSILVTPIRPEEEPWFTRLKRPAERLLLRR
jgi:HAD superfamily phosphatase (TIGR01668 family)